MSVEIIQMQTDHNHVVLPNHVNADRKDAKRLVSSVDYASSHV